MQFPNPIVKFLIIVDNNGFPVVTIGPGPDIKLTSPNGSQIDLNAGDISNPPTMFFYNDDRTNYGYINLGIHSTGLAYLGVNSGTYINGSGHLIRPRMYMQNQIALQLVDSTQQPEGGEFSISDNSADMRFRAPTTHAFNGGEIFVAINSATVQFNNTAAKPSSQIVVFDQTVDMHVNDAATGATDLSQIYLQSNGIGLQSGDGTGLNGPMQTFDASSIQFKNTLAQVNPVKYDETTKFMGVDGGPWTACALFAGWSNVPGFTPLMAMITPDGFVRFMGNIQNGTITNGTVIALTPSGNQWNVYQGLKARLYIGVRGGAPSTGNILMNGLGQMQINDLAAGSNNLCFDGVGFPTTHL